MGWIFLILGGIVLVDIVSLFSSHIGNQKRREAYNTIVNERLTEMEKDNNDLRNELEDIRAYALDVVHQVNARSAEVEDCMNTVFEYNEKICGLFHDLKERVLLFSDLTADDADPNEAKHKLNLLVECVLQDDEKIRQYEEICEAKRIAHRKHIPIDPIEYSVDIGGADCD